VYSAPYHIQPPSDIAGGEPGHGSTDQRNIFEVIWLKQKLLNLVFQLLKQLTNALFSSGQVPGFVRLANIDGFTQTG
jgi:hypothetical protein